MTSFYRKAAWLALGMTNFTHQAFKKHSAHFTDDLESISLTNKVAMVTGSNTGLGYEIARSWFNRGGTVHMVCRNGDTANEAKNKILEQYAEYIANNQSINHSISQMLTESTGVPSIDPLQNLSLSNTSSLQDPSDRIFVHIVDLSSIKQIKSFARAWCSSHKQLNVLINNAGAMIHKEAADKPPSQTNEGLESNFALNAAGLFVLTKELLPVLRESNSAGFLSRVVTMSSGGALVSDLNIDDLQCSKHCWEGTDATFVYAHNKRCAISLTEEFDRREQAAQGEFVPRVNFHVCHPGWAETDGVKTAMPEFHSKLAGKWRSPAEGVDTALWLSMAPPASHFPTHIASGKFWLDREPVRATLLGARYVGVDDKTSHMLYEKLLELTGPIEPFDYDLMHRYDYLAPATPSSRSRVGSGADKSNNQSIKQTINQSIDQPTEQSVDQSTISSVDHAEQQPETSNVDVVTTQ